MICERYCKLIFENTYKFCGSNPNKFVLILMKRVQPYEYINS